MKMLDILRGRFTLCALALLFLGLVFGLVGPSDVFASSGPNGSTTIVGSSATLTPAGHYIVNPGSTFTISVELCDTSGGVVQPYVTGSVTGGGAGITSPDPDNVFNVPANSCRYDNWTVRAPSAVQGASCSGARGSFLITIDGSGSGYGSHTKDFYTWAEVGLSVVNNTSSTIFVHVAGTNFGGAIPADFSVSAGSGNVGGPEYLWNVDCYVYPTVSITISVTGGTTGTFSGSATTVNGCHFQVRITVSGGGGGGGTKPGAFNLSNEFTGCSGSYAYVQFFWGSASGATSYDIYWGTGGSPGPSPQVANVSSGYQNNFFFPPGVTITWNVVARNQYGSTTSNQTWTLTTQSPCPPSGGGGGTAVDLQIATCDGCAFGNGPASDADNTFSLRWYVSNATSCTASNTAGNNNWNSVAGVPSSSSLTSNGGPHGTGTITSTTTFTLNCNGVADSVAANYTAPSGGGGSNDFTLTGNGTTSVTVSAGSTVDMRWTHSATSASRTSCNASPNYNADWGSSNPSSSALMNNGSGHGVRNVTTSVTLSVTCYYSSGNSPVTKSVNITVSGAGGSTYALNVSTAGTGSGTVSGPGINCTRSGGVTTGDCTESFSANTAVTLTAAPAFGSGFAGWLYDCTGTGFCYLTMNGNKSVTAQFAPTAVTSCIASPSSAAINQNVAFSLSSGGTIFSAGPYPADATWVSTQYNGSGQPVGVTLRFSQSGSKSFPMSPSSGSTVTCTASITATLAPTNDIKANGSDISINIAYNTSATISWTSANATSCTITKNGVSWSTALSSGGTNSGNLTQNTTFTISCIGSGGSSTPDSVTVNVSQPPPAKPDGPSLFSFCDGGSLAVRVTWFDNASNETNYFVDVSSDGFATWAHTSPSQTPAIAGTGGAGIFWWSAANPLNTTGGTGSGPITPAINTNYYFRINAYNGQNSFSYYNNTFSGTSTLPGIVFNTGNPCVPTSMTVDLGGKTCATGPYTVTLSWNGATTSDWWVDLDNDGNWGNGYIGAKNAGPVNSTVAPTGFSSSPQLLPGFSYYWRIWNGTHYYPPNGSTTPPGTPFTLPWCVPGGLSRTTNPTTCATGPYTVTFKWSSGGVAGDNWWLNFENDNPSDWDDNNDGIAESDIPSLRIPAGTNGSTGFTISNTFQPDVTYRWVIYYGNGSGTTARFVVPASNDVTNDQLISGSGFTPSADYTFVLPMCIDLSVTFDPVKNPGTHTFNAGSTAAAVVTVTNNGPADLTSDRPVGIWITPPSPGTPDPSYPNCPTTSGGAPAGQAFTVSASAASPFKSLANGGTPIDFTFNFNVGNNGGTGFLDAYMMPACPAAVPESNWNNNGTRPPHTGQRYTYSVTVNAWFETSGGDAGAQGTIDSQVAPPTAPTAKYNSQYIVIGSSVANTIVSSKWKLNNYKDSNGAVYPLMPAGTYNYLADRYRSKATTSQCTVTSLGAGLSFCTGNVQIGNGNATIETVNVPSANVGWFIDGNLTITDNVVVPSGGAIAFIVSGNVTVNTNVTRIDGIYIAGGTFNDTTDGANLQGPQLVVNGAVYARTAALARKLGGVSCAPLPACDNGLYPAEVFNFDPKYVTNLTSILATPAVSWQEVAP